MYDVLDNNDIDKYKKYTSLKLLGADFNKLIRKYSPEDRYYIKVAYSFAKASHANQLRLDKTPYFSHCLAVAVLAMENGENVEIVCAGFLHDTIEDTPVTEEAIKHIMGETVARLVVLLTKPWAQNHNLKKNIKGYYDKIKLDENAARLKGFDRFANLCSVTTFDKGVAWRNKYARETKEMVLPMIGENSLISKRIKTILSDLNMF